MKKQLDLIALGNALTDITVNVHERDLKALGIKKGSVKGLSYVNPTVFSKILLKSKQEFCQAGSPSNVIFNAATLGLETGLIGCVGYDKIGKEYIKKLKEKRIESIFNIGGRDSGICYILITPDGERTSIADLGVSGNFGLKLEDVERLETKILHTSGYEVSSNPEKAIDIIYEFKDMGAKISFDLAADKMIRQQREKIENIVKDTDILFATEEEARELTGKAPFKALEELAKICPITVLKRGSKGSVVKNKKEQHKIKAYPTKIINTCGAGDAYAAGFLFSYIRGFNPEECGCMGSYIASRVCNSKKSHLNI